MELFAHGFLFSLKKINTPLQLLKLLEFSDVGALDTKES